MYNIAEVNLTPKSLLSLLIALCLIVSSQAKDFVVEYAYGIGSPYSPFSSFWSGAVNSHGLFYREQAMRISFTRNEYVTPSLALGWMKDRATLGPISPTQGQVLSPVPGDNSGYYSRTRQVTYLLPSFRISYVFASLDLGAFIYKTSGEFSGEKFPFDGEHDFKPSLGLSLGDANLYAFTGIYNSFPLNSGGGGWTFGVGRKWSGLYEHKLYLFSAFLDAIGFGYRGEARVYRNNALSFGLLVGGADRHDIYAFTLGIKSLL